MDAIEFFDTISVMCKEGAKTEYYKKQSRDREISKGDWGRRLDWDITTVMKNYFSLLRIKGYEQYGLDKHHRDSLRNWKSIYPPYEDFFIHGFSKDVKLALIGYLSTIKEDFYKDNVKFRDKRRTPGWYIGAMPEKVMDNPDLLITDFYSIINANKRFIVGYRGSGEIDMAGRDSFDLHFSADRIYYYNINHAKSFARQLSFDPMFYKGMSFMNWDDNPLQ